MHNVQLRHVDADRPAGLARVDVLVDDQVVADLDWRACQQCGIAVIEHVRADPTHRRHGYARRAVRAAHTRAPWCSWSTTAVTGPAAQAFWTSVAAWIDTGPRYCPHMTGGLDVPD
jgi:GNAT superfamily N-acetyltransferase